MTAPRLSRRALLGTLSASAAFLAGPVLRGSRAFAQTAPPPRRLVVMFSPVGTLIEQWRPTGAGAAFAFAPGSILEPLTPLRSKLLVLEGVHMESTASGPGAGHPKGAGHLLTGRAMLPGAFDFGGGSVGYAGGISVDQHIAASLPRATAFRSLEFGVRTEPNPKGRIIYAGADMPMPPMEDPVATYNRVFGAAMAGTPMEVARVLAERRSALDYARSELAALGRRLGADDRARLDAHAQSIRELETRLTSATMSGVHCVRPARPAMIAFRDVANFPTVGDLQTDLLVMALKCNLTRVASLQWSVAGASTLNFSWLTVDGQPIRESHHSLSHEGDSNLLARRKLVAINRWYAERFLRLNQQLDATPEGAGTMLDNTVVVWCNELGRGNTHSFQNVPFVLAGSCGGAFRPGRYLQLGAVPHNNLLVSLCQAMGMAATTTFGDPAFCTGPIATLA